MKIVMIIAAAGSSVRMGEDKLLLRIGKRHIIEICLFNVLKLKEISKIVISSKPETLNLLKAHPVFSKEERLSFVEGGTTRGESISNALENIDFDYDALLIHDAARFLLPETVFERIIEGLEENDAVIPALRIPDSCYRLTHGKIAKIDRTDLLRAQTPQGFKKNCVDIIKKCYKNRDTNYTDETAICLENGINISFVEGSRYLEKITYKEDVPYFEKLSRLYQEDEG